MINGIKVMVGVFPMFGRIQLFALFSGTVSLLAPSQVSKEWILTHGIANLQVPFDMGSFRTLPLVIGGGSPWFFSFVQHAGDVLNMLLEVNFDEAKTLAVWARLWLSRRADRYRLWILSMGIVT